MGEICLALGSMGGEWIGFYQSCGNMGSVAVEWVGGLDYGLAGGGGGVMSV